MNRQGRTIKLNPIATGVSFPDQDTLEVRYADGRILKVPLFWSHRLAGATEEQRNTFEIWDEGRIVAWPQIDEHIDVESLLKGATLIDWPDDISSRIADEGLSAQTG